MAKSHIEAPLLLLTLYVQRSRNVVLLCIAWWFRYWHLDLVMCSGIWPFGVGESHFKLEADMSGQTTKAAQAFSKDFAKVKGVRSIYISGKATGLPIKECRMKFAEAQAMIETETSLIVRTVNPLQLDHPLNSTWLDYMKKDIAAMMQCGAVYMLNNWRHSDEATIEHDLAMKIGMPIIYEPC